MKPPESLFDHATDTLDLQLSKARFDDLIVFVQRPDGVHRSGGWQSRRRKWNERLNVRERRILLDADDRDFIARNIANRDGGGFQYRIYEIFVASHPIFTGIPKKAKA
jgi:hypothetical protein